MLLATCGTAPQAVKLLLGEFGADVFSVALTHHRVGSACRADLQTLSYGRLLGGTDNHSVDPLNNTVAA